MCITEADWLLVLPVFLPREWINNQGGIESATQKIIDTDRNAHPWGWHPWWK